MRLLDRLLARDRTFVETFDRLATRLTAAARLLVQLFTAEPARRQERVNEIAGIATQANELTHQVRRLVDQAVITPLDPDDMLLLAARFNAVVEGIDGIARRVMDFHVGDIPPVARRLAQVLATAGEHLEVAMRSIGQSALVHTRAELVKRCEEEGDGLYATAVEALFASERARADVLEVLKWKELYDQLEDALDTCEDVANAIESISVKRA
jgi:uncharacterized protein Yka (UPF0111/DUF47 family)